MPTTTFELRVEMEGGATHDVVADQRDMAKWEVQDFGCPMPELDSRMHLGYRWMAWSAMTRRGLTELPWPEFNEQCVEAIDLPEAEDQADAEGRVDDVDPGQPAPSAKTSSRSRGARANR